MNTNDDYKDLVAEKILTDDDYVFEFLKVVYNNQTEWEQDQRTTVDANGRGFNIADAKRLTAIAEAGIKRGGYLLPEELAECRKLDKRGRNLAQYRRQVPLTFDADQVVVRLPRKPPTSESGAQNQEEKTA